MNEIVVETLRAGDEEQLLGLNRQAFGGPERDPDRPATGRERIVAAYEGDRLVATVTTHELGQFFGGRSVPMGGLANVVVSPHLRGRGLARRLVERSFDAMVGRGEVISALYPTTGPLYRSMGYEMAGTYGPVELPLGQLPADAGPTEFEPSSWAAAAADMARLYRTMAVANDGWLDRSELVWSRNQHIWEQDRRPAYLYVGRRDGAVVAVVAYWYRAESAALYDLEVVELCAADGAARHDTLAFLGAHGTTVDKIRFWQPPRSLGLHLTGAEQVGVAEPWRWMLRLVDAPAAVAARGCPAGLTGQLHLHVADDVRADNAGPHVLSVDAGAARLERGGDGRIGIDVRDLAAVYSGYQDPVGLRYAGRLPGADEGDARFLRAVFSGADPTLVDFF